MRDSLKGEVFPPVFASEEGVKGKPRKAMVLPVSFRAVPSGQDLPWGARATPCDKEGTLLMSGIEKVKSGRI